MPRPLWSYTPLSFGSCEADRYPVLSAEGAGKQGQIPFSFFHGLRVCAGEDFLCGHAVGVGVAFHIRKDGLISDFKNEMIAYFDRRAPHWDWETLKTLVPPTTYAYFTSPEAAPVLERIRKAGNVVHY